MGGPALRVFSIPPRLPFLPTLAKEILGGRIVPGVGADAGDPLALAALTIYVPTRRAGQTLAAALAAELGGVSAILPRIRTLGEEDEAAGFRPDSPSTLLPAMEPLHRRLLLARLIRFWKTQLAGAALDVLGEEELVLPASAADAVWMASDLAALMDEAAGEGIDLGGLARIDMSDRLAGWWQLTQTFLSIVTEHWPGELAALQLADAAALRLELARQEAARYRTEGSRDPVLVAGAVTSVGATLDLMKAIAGLPNGAVVLPGLDKGLDDDAFQRVRRAHEAAAAGHPQYTLARMLDGLGVSRADVREIDGPAAPALRARETLFSEAMRPAETTERWHDAALDLEAGLDGVCLIEAADEADEALAIAIAMREALSEPGSRVALATPDRSLGRRVCAELERFGISANDSAGRPLAATPPGELVRLALQAALTPGDPVVLLSLMKHPLTRLGMTPADVRRGARAVEIVALRGGTGVADASGLAALYERRRRQRADDTRVARAVELLPEADLALGAAVAEALELALAPLTALRSETAMELAPQAMQLTLALEGLSADPEGTPATLYAEEAGQVLAAWLRDLVSAPATEFAFAPAELPDVVTALMADRRVAPRGGLSHRAFVWGALEARLQSVDTLILGGLDEGTWPQGARADAFLSRLMRTEILLDPPERRIGLAAHDLWMSIGNRRLILTRAERRGGAPSIASRWIQRLAAVAGPDATSHLRQRGAAYIAEARLLDTCAELPRHPRPEPRPPVEFRPDRISVTEVERLVRDPYAVYARRILKLEPFEPLIRAPGAAERGTLFHDILADVVSEGLDLAAPDALSALLDIARARFAAADLPPEIEAVWWPRMEGLARRYLAWEHERSPRIRIRRAELGGRLELADTGLTLTGYADRIDLTVDGGAEIIDFKTGLSPSIKQARTLLAPQLPLEGAMLKLGAFDGLAAGTPIAGLSYVRLRERDFVEEALATPGSAKSEAITVDALADAAVARLRALGAAYRNPTKGYLSRARPFIAADLSGDYDQLARSREWAMAEEGSEEKE
ncbi:double-strand break repair protein AddB [Aureimonas altamirensis]|nr:double-strand break repair protein AddB [Aureimonas altamirensis]UHD45686.1 double-strand break repair protein AddB [Aureimonas altamirensis]